MIRSARRPDAALLACALLLAGVSPAAAQSTRSARGPIDVFPSGMFPEQVAGEGPSLGERLLSALGGAALGAGIGFFASQVYVGDWDDGPGRELNRGAWAMVGGSVGFAAGVSFPVRIGRRARPSATARGAGTGANAPDAGAVVISGAALRDGPVTVLDALKRKVPNFRVMGYTDKCPDVALRNYVSLNDTVNPHVYVDGARSTNTCILETLRTLDVLRVEVYSRGVTSRAGYAPNPAGLILIFVRRTQSESQAIGGGWQ